MLQVVDMASQMESIDDDLQPGTPKLPQMLQERLDLSPSKDKKRGGGRSRLAQASFPSGNLANGQPGPVCAPAGPPVALFATRCCPHTK